MSENKIEREEQVLEREGKGPNHEERGPGREGRGFGRGGRRGEGKGDGHEGGSWHGERSKRRHFDIGKKGDLLLEVKDLTVEYTSGGRTVNAVNGVSFTICRDEALGVVGESGCGKSTIAKAILRILPDRAGRIAGGEILYHGEDLVTKTSAEMQQIRGAEIAMIFQDPMTALNPVKRILKQVSSVIALHNPGISKKEANERAVHMLQRVGIAPDRVRQYPHQFSGGMQQRVETAIALSCHPDLLLADEPTTALDVTMQAQVLDMITDLMREKNTALLLITHNLGIVAETCDNVAVVYGGEIVEYGSKREIFKDPRHPYTKGLFGALPSKFNEGQKLHPIDGVMPEPSELPPGCKFHTRCPYATDICKEGPVPVVDLGGTHRCQCHHIEAAKEENAE
ncbi:MAG: ABC transporter ATP-binding protein [Oscillospiraceae bacterium]